MKRRTLRADALMLITALIWGTTFVAQSKGMEHIGPFLYTGLPTTASPSATCCKWPARPTFYW